MALVDRPTDVERITRSPSLADYTPLSEHQSATPETFFGAKPVLHLYSPASTLVIRKEDLESQPILAGFQPTPTSNGTGQSNGSTHEEKVNVEGVDVWVTSESLILFLPSQSTGLKIPYPRIASHGTNTPTNGQAIVILQLDIVDPTPSDDDSVSLECHLIPSSAAPLSSPAETDAGGEAPQSPVQALYLAISECQDLNTDPWEDEEDEEEDETAPGAGGWITSDNLDEFVDENGDLDMTRFPALQNDSLGPGAGAVREREDEDGETGDTKWQRTG